MYSISSVEKNDAPVRKLNPTTEIWGKDLLKAHMAKLQHFAKRRASKPVEVPHWRLQAHEMVDCTLSSQFDSEEDVRVDPLTQAMANFVLVESNVYEGDPRLKMQGRNLVKQPRTPPNPACLCWQTNNRWEGPKCNDDECINAKNLIVCPTNCKMGMMYEPRLS
ncbi:Aste57867_3538 [Aphanomyces stellatus]|uniref:Aste57867_3538 protein n=1 Tax=Aphanomyces stellatus TaxID=120398 RepID=A0A485K9W9_9STRA|nr:hypothetical protein As57867_003527 [Aphanomyces stellatus]VFT80701.1 Aste57867_3538 [Aphanomyces stellatus]